MLKHVGDIRQIANVRLCELSDGPGRGVRVAEFTTGSGFAFTANCLVHGRQAERERGTLQMLAPGESREMILRLGAVEGEKALAALIEKI